MLKNSWNLVNIDTMKKNFPKENPKVDSDLVVVHKERYIPPNFDSFGKKRRTDSYDSTWKKVLLCQKEVPLETTSLFLERQIAYVEISQFEIITRKFRAFKTRTTF